MVSEPIELFGPKSMAVEKKPVIGMQKEQQEMKHTRKLRRLKYSCEEVYERMDNGLCIFCDELDTPGHHDLKHKGIQIFMVDDNLASDYIKEFHQSQETVTSPEPIVETAKNLDSFIEPLVHDSVSQALDSVPDMLMVHKVEELPQKSASGSGKKIAHQLFDQMPNEYQKDLTMIESSDKEVLSFSHKDDRVWEPGGLPTKMDLWNWKELKPYGESHKVKSNPEFNTFESNKTFSLEDEHDDETNAETNSLLEKERIHSRALCDQVPATQSQDFNVIQQEKLIHDTETIMEMGPVQEPESLGLTDSIFKVDYVPSQFQVPIPSLEPSCRRQKESLAVINDLSCDLGCIIGKTIECICDSEIGKDNSLDEVEFNRVWEPGGVLIEHDKWKGSEKCYELSRVVRLMQGLSSTRWSCGKVAELNQELQQPKTYLKEIKLKELDRLVTCSSVGCIVALLMVYEAERIQSEGPPIFSDLLCVKNRIQGRLKMVLLLEFLWLILFTSKMFKSFNVPQNKNQTDQKLSSYWKLLLSWKNSQNIHVSSRCVLRQEESYVKVLELIKDRDSRKRKLCKNWWFKYKLNTWLSEALHFWRKRKYEKLQRASEHMMCELIHKIRKACQCVVHETNETASHVWYWWKTKAEIVQIVLKPIMHLKGKEETFSFKDAVTNCSSKTKISGHVLKQVFGRATHGLFLKQSLSQVLLHIQNRDCSFFGYMLMATSDCFGTLLEIPDKEIAKPHNIYVLKALILWKWYPPEQATWIFSELVQNSWDMSIFGKSRTWLLCKMRILHDLKDLRQFTRAGIKFHLKHKWRSKFGSNKPTRTWTSYNRYDSSSCVLRQEKNYVMALFPIGEALTLVNDQHTLVAQKKGTETSTGCCYGFHADLDLMADVTTGTADISMDEFSSVCKLLFGVFVLNLIADQVRDWSFFGLLLQWKWHPPPQATSEFHQAHNDKPVFHL